MSISTADYSQCLTPPLDWSTGKVGASTSHLSCESFTGCGPESVLTSNSPSSSSRWRPVSSWSGAELPIRRVWVRRHIRRVADTNRPRLRSSSSALLTVRPTRLVTMGDRAFLVAGSSRLWNSLPHEVTSASTLPFFCSRLKTYLFQLSFPTN